MRWPRQSSFEHERHQIDSGNVFRVKQNAHPFAMRDERFGPSEGFGKASEPSGVTAGPKNRWVLSVTHNWANQNSKKSVGRGSGTSPAGQVRAINVALKKLPLNLVVVQQ